MPIFIKIGLEVPILLQFTIVLKWTPQFNYG